MSVVCKSRFSYNIILFSLCFFFSLFVCVLVIGCGSLRVVRWLLSVACCLLFVASSSVPCFLLVVCGLLFIVCRLPVVVCCLVFGVVCCVL